MQATNQLTAQKVTAILKKAGFTKANYYVGRSVVGHTNSNGFNAKNEVDRVWNPNKRSRYVRNGRYIMGAYDNVKTGNVIVEAWASTWSRSDNAPDLDAIAETLRLAGLNVVKVDNFPAHLVVSK